MTAPARLQRQIAFAVEIDKLKSVERRTWLTDRSRREDSAGHSWHFALMCVLLAEHAAEPGLDLAHAVKMALVHDLVEIDAGDTFVYDEQGTADKPERERAAADRLFGLLPADQAAEFRALWDEYEERRTPEARYAAALDRLQPILNNYHTGGAAWQEHGITAGQVIARNRHMAEGAPRLWEYAQGLIRDAVKLGMLRGE